MILLTPNVKQDMGATYKVTAKYASPIAEEKAAVVKPFIYRTDDEDLTPGLRKEVHLPFEAPTAKADPKFFGTSDDKSDPASGRYYVRAESYPFAFFLSGATEVNLAKLLEPHEREDAHRPALPRLFGLGGIERRRQRRLVQIAAAEITKKASL